MSTGKQQNTKDLLSTQLAFSFIDTDSSTDEAAGRLV